MFYQTPDLQTMTSWAFVCVSLLIAGLVAPGISWPAVVVKWELSV